MALQEFLLRSSDANNNAYTPYDKMVLFREVTLAGGTADIDLSNYLHDDAACEYMLFRKATLSSGALTVVTESNTAIADDDTVVVMIITDPHNVKDHPA